MQQAISVLCFHDRARKPTNAMETVLVATSPWTRRELYPTPVPVVWTHTCDPNLMQLLRWWWTDEMAHVDELVSKRAAPSTFRHVRQVVQDARHAGTFHIHYTTPLSRSKSPPPPQPAPPHTSSSSAPSVPLSSFVETTRLVFHPLFLENVLCRQYQEMDGDEDALEQPSEPQDKKWVNMPATNQPARVSNTDTDTDADIDAGTDIDVDVDAGTESHTRMPAWEYGSKNRVDGREPGFSSITSTVQSLSVLPSPVLSGPMSAVKK